MENETVSFEAIIDVDEARKGVSAEGDDVSIGGSMMEVLDGVFMPLMAYCAADSDVPLDAVPQLKIDPLAEASPEMLRAEEVAAAAKFRALKAYSSPQPDKNGNFVPRSRHEAAVVRK